MDTFLLTLRVTAIAVFGACMIWAAVSDIRTFEVPNRVPIAILLAFPFFVLGTGAGWDAVLNGVLTAVAVLGVGFGLFVARVIGAGDVKLLAAVALWTGWPALIPYLFFVSLTGGVLALILIVFRRLTLPDGIGRIGWIRQLYDRKKDVPYAVAIALPAIFQLPGLLLK